MFIIIIIIIIIIVKIVTLIQGFDARLANRPFLVLLTYFLTFWHSGAQNSLVTVLMLELWTKMC